MLTDPPRVLSVIPPMTQLNTPYPSTAYLTGFLRSRGIDAVQEDLALKLVLELFSANGLQAVFDEIDQSAGDTHSESVQHFCVEIEQYKATVHRVISFLQGRDSTCLLYTSPSPRDS